MFDFGDPVEGSSFRYHDYEENVVNASNATIKADVGDTSFLLIQFVLSSVSTVLIYIALYEFICTQSPTHMRGLLIGLSLATEGIGEVLGASVAAIFPLGRVSLPSNGMYYYLVNIVVGLHTLLLYILAATRYKFRPTMKTRGRTELWNTDQNADKRYSEEKCN